MVRPMFVSGREGEGEGLIAPGSVAHARYSCTLGHEPRLIVFLITRGYAPVPNHPGNMAVANLRLEIRGPEATALWDQLRTVPSERGS